jgi:hypothetical protein
MPFRKKKEAISVFDQPFHILRDHEDGDPELTVKLTQRGNDLLGSDGIQFGGRIIQ